jgi:hypothetical protein
MAGKAADWQGRASRALAVVLGAVGLCWPALWCCYPFLNVDCITYLSSGRRVLQLLLGDRSLSSEYLRSEIYSAGIYLLHWNRSAWPIIAFDALLTAWTIWLLVRALVPLRLLRLYAGLVAFLCVFTTASWCVCDVLPDSLGAVLYLSLFLLVFARESLRRWETVTLSGVACWAVTTHPTYVPIASGLCAMLALSAWLGWMPMQGRAPGLLQVTGIVLLAMAAEAGVHARIFGKPSLMGQHQPYLMARIVADGPAHDYLREHCATLHWVICESVDKLPWSEVDFLWSPNGIYASATPAQRQALSAEELPLILGTLRAYPLRQAGVSFRNFIAQLTQFAIDAAPYENPWMISMCDLVIPGMQAKFRRANERGKALHRPLFATVQKVVVGLSAAATLLLLPWVWRRHQRPEVSRLLGLSVVVAYVVLANAALTGVLSGVSPRYEGRVIWLLPMLAYLLLVRWRMRGPLEDAAGFANSGTA